MARSQVPRQTQEQVLVMSRRRCSICMGLSRDAEIKQGQIAHLDGDASNNELDNLVFLCLAHHDEYDTARSQSKGLTIDEVRRYRKELHELIDKAWTQPVIVGRLKVPAPGDPSGRYAREGEFESAEVAVKLLASGRVHVSGFAVWGKTRHYGPNFGELEFEADLENGFVVHTEPFLHDEVYRLEFRFNGERLTATENHLGPFGMNVSFAGEYLRIE